MKSLRNNQGFLLIDALIAIVVVAIGLVALTSALGAGTKAWHSASLREKSVQVAAERLEYLKHAHQGTEQNLDELVKKANQDNPVEVEKDKFTATIVVDTDNGIENNSEAGRSSIKRVAVRVTKENSTEVLTTLTGYVVLE